MSRSTPATHGDAGTTQLLAHGGRRDAKLGTDLAQAPALAVQVGCTLNVHRDTVTSFSRIVGSFGSKSNGRRARQRPTAPGRAGGRGSGAASRRARGRGDRVISIAAGARPLRR